MNKPLFDPASSPYRVSYNGDTIHQQFQTTPPDGVPNRKALKAMLEDETRILDQLQRQLYAHDRYGVLLVFQALDAAGKDSTIRSVFRRVDPVGLNVHSFKAPSKLELEHDFLWRSNCVLPKRGSIGVFNRSYYEEVLVVRVHPKYLGGQRLPPHDDLDVLWQQRFESIRRFEEHMARSGTVVIKFWLKHSRDEQRNRFLSRLDTPEKQWKFHEGDAFERGYWDQYMDCYQDVINATSRPHAPWYVIPADDKVFMRYTVADIINRSLSSLHMAWPDVSARDRSRFAMLREQLLND